LKLVIDGITFALKLLLIIINNVFKILINYLNIIRYFRTDMMRAEKQTEFKYRRISTLNSGAKLTDIKGPIQGMVTTLIGVPRRYL
jgi:hypothetical protein